MALTMRAAKLERARFGRFFYRFPNGESGLDVFNRVTSFISTIARDGEHVRRHHNPYPSL